MTRLCENVPITMERDGARWVVRAGGIVETRVSTEAEAIEWYDFFSAAVASVAVSTNDVDASCEQCGSHDVHLHDSPRLSCRETGYVDGGDFWRCVNCRAEWEAGVVIDHAGDAADLRYRQGAEG